MDEQNLFTHIGSEIGVTVYFDYQPEEPSEPDYPGCPSEVTLNAVYVDGSQDRDILEVLDDQCCRFLERECGQMVIDNAREAYESSQEES